MTHTALLLFTGLLNFTEPGFVMNRNQLMVQLPREMVFRPEVRKYLDSGLTTTLIISVRGQSDKGKRLQGWSRLDIRFEPWDEVFFVKIWGRDGAERTLEPMSKEAMEKLLTSGQIDVASPEPDQKWVLETRLQVLPFSEMEKKQTQEWFSKTLGSRNRKDAGRLMDLIFNASIKRKTTIYYSWKTEFQS